MDDVQKNRLREYAWNYFVCHAEQRLKTFHLYLILVSVIIAGFTTALNYSEDHRWLCSFGFILSFLSLVFWTLDRRNRELVKNGEAALNFLDECEGLEDNDDEPHILKIFKHDDYMIKRNPNVPFLHTHVTYSKFLILVFTALGLAGLGAGIACLVV